MPHNHGMSIIPPHILAQIPVMAAQGLSVERMAFLLRLSPSVIKAELSRLGLSVPEEKTTTDNEQEAVQGQRRTGE